MVSLCTHIKVVYTVTVTNNVTIIRLTVTKHQQLLSKMTVHTEFCSHLYYCISYS